ncbi:hypothetical protein ACFY0A_37245 [Streptomyces sp. NPDC001698]|uniref:hypothetical protein n=1 Tax=unclassified Streptomyces TaxID=2593676 RepID=UPI00368D735A
MTHASALAAPPASKAPGAGGDLAPYAATIAMGMSAGFCFTAARTLKCTTALACLGRVLALWART